jgi:hypothetical protein
MAKILSAPDLTIGNTPKRMAGPVVGGVTEATLYTVPASTIAIVRNIHVCNTSGAAVTFKMGIGADAAGTRLFSDASVPANGVFDWDGFLMLAAAETLRWTAAATLTVVVSGMEVL